MKRVRVVSTVLASVGYERGVLEVAFVSGNVYQYLDVPQDVYDGLLAAASHGAYFNDVIRDEYQYLRLS